MKTQRKSAPRKVSVQLWVVPQLREDFKQAVAQEERTTAQAIRRYMAETVERSKQAA